MRNNQRNFSRSGDPTPPSFCSTIDLLLLQGCKKGHAKYFKSMPSLKWPSIGQTEKEIYYKEVFDKHRKTDLADSRCQGLQNSLLAPVELNKNISQDSGVYCTTITKQLLYSLIILCHLHEWNYWDIPGISLEH